jgi:hypothetical protein
VDIRRRKSVAADYAQSRRCLTWVARTTELIGLISFENRKACLKSSCDVSVIILWWNQLYRESPSEI